MTLNTLLAILWARWKILLFTFGMVVATAVGVSLWLPKSYTATATVLVDPKGADQLTGMASAAPFAPGYMATQRDILSSHNVALKVVRRLKLAQAPQVVEQFRAETEGKGTVEDWIAGVILRKLEVEPSRDSNVVRVSYVGSDPQFAQALANAFAQSYIDTALELKVEPSRETASWFDKQTKAARENLDRAQAKLSAFQRKSGIVASDERIDVETYRLNELSSQLVQLQGQTYDSESRTRQAERARSGGADALPEIVASQLIQSLQLQLTQREAELTTVLSQFGANHPENQRARREVESVKEKIRAETEKITRSVSNVHDLNVKRENDVRRALAQQKARVLELKQQRDEMQTLQREVENVQRAYDLVLQRYNQTNMESKQNQTNVMMLNAAVVPIKASSPNLLLNTLAALALGAILGISIALASESFDQRVRSATQLTEALGTPLLGHVQRVRTHKRGKWRMLARLVAPFRGRLKAA